MKGEDLGFPMGQGTLTAFCTREGGGRGMGEREENRRRGGVENFNI